MTQSLWVHRNRVFLRDDPSEPHAVGVAYDVVFDMAGELTADELLNLVQESATVHLFKPDPETVLGLMKQGFGITSVGATTVRLARPSAHRPVNLVDLALLERLALKFRGAPVTLAQACFTATVLTPSVAQDLSVVGDVLTAMVETGFMSIASQQPIMYQPNTWVMNTTHIRDQVIDAEAESHGYE